VIRYVPVITLFAGLSTLGAANARWSAEVQSNLTAAIQATTNSFYFRNPGRFQYNKVWEQGPLFTQALDRLGKLIDHATAAAAEAENTIENKIVSMAYHRAHQPGDFEKIESIYCDRSACVRRYRKMYGDYPLPRLFSPGISTNYCEEKYRLAWEYLLLRPRTTNFLELCDYRAREAISSIKNAKSIVTLEYQFRFVASIPHRGRDLDLLTICNFPGEKGLEALLRCVALSDGQPATTELGSPTWNAADGVYKVLAGSEDPVYREKWAPVLQAYSGKANALSEKERRFLKRLNEMVAQMSINARRPSENLTHEAPK
jgi:hypothetical protein